MWPDHKFINLAGLELPIVQAPMANDLLNAGADVVTIQYLLGHSRIKTTLRYARMSNQRARMDFYQSMDRVVEAKGNVASFNVLW